MSKRKTGTFLLGGLIGFLAKEAIAAALDLDMDFDIDDVTDLDDVGDIDLDELDSDLLTDVDEQASSIFEESE